MIVQPWLVTQDVFMPLRLSEPGHREVRDQFGSTEVGQITYV